MSFYLAALLACAAPAAAAAADTAAVQKPEAPSTEALQAELAAYGAWLNQAIGTDQPLQQGLRTFGERWESTFSRGINPATIGQMRGVVRSLADDADRAHAAIDALPQLTLRVLPLEPDLQPAALVRDLKAINRQIRTLVDSFNPVLDAMARNDERAAYRALGGTISGIGLLYQSQITMSRAGLALTPREESSWNMGNVGLLFFRAGARVLAAWPADMVSGTDRSLAADLRALAGELEATSAEGEMRLTAEVADARAELAAAERGGDPAQATILRSGLSVGEIDREIFVQGRRLAAVLHGGADRFESGRITLEALGGLFGEMMPIKVRLDEIALQESAALAAGR